MYEFPEGLYTDVRIEDFSETKILFTLGKLDDCRVRTYKAAFIRIFDGQRWYYSSTSDPGRIQDEIALLSSYAGREKNIGQHPVVEKFPVNKGRFISYAKKDINAINLDDKLNLLTGCFPLLDVPPVKMWKAFYLDRKEMKEFYSSKGSSLLFDTQRAGFSFSFDMADGDRRLSEDFQRGSNYFHDLTNQEEHLRAYLAKCEDFLAAARPVTPGKYTVILSPQAAGIFAHESFGHKSEADFMVGDETMKKEWVLGKKVGSSILSIVDDGTRPGMGFTPFDDEGTAAGETFLIRDGILSGRLHSATTAALLEEDLTGNARAVNFEFEPIVRMTTTYIMPGLSSLQELISEVEDGFLVETIKHGSGLSTFTMAPSLAYRIKNGKVDEPVNIAVLTGSVFETLGEIDGLSDQLVLVSFIRGGCGKMEQFPLPVGFGGPYVRIKNMNVQ